MSNFLAIATTTATLQRILQQAVQTDVDGARVTSSRPENSGGGVPETGVNLYLYHIKRNPAWKNADVPGRQRKGPMSKRNQVALDLYYLMAFHGNDAELEPQRLLGSVLRTLEDWSILSPEIIRETINNPSLAFLADSDLDQQVEMIRLEFIPLSTEELSKIWSVFFQTPYSLSVVYKVTVVVLEGDEVIKPALPVRDYRLTTRLSVMLGQPVIAEVVALEGKLQPILATSTLVVRGRSLAMAGTRLRLLGGEIAPPTVTQNEIRLPLSLIPRNALRAGVQVVQVVHPAPANSRNGAAASNNGTALAQLAIESNAASFVLCPTIVQLMVSNVDGFEDEVRSLTLTLETDVMIGRNQRLLLMLNERTTQDPAAYRFRRTTPLEEDSHQVDFRLRGIKPGEYLVRIQINGAESLLTLDPNPTSPTFEQYLSPSVTIL